MSRFTRLLALLCALAVLAACGTDEGDTVTVAAEGDEETEEPGDDSAGTEGGDEASGGSDADDEAAEGGGESDDAADEAEQISEGDVDDGEAEVAVFVVRDVDGYLWVESDVRTLSEPVDAVATAAMEELFGAEPTNPGLRAPAGTDVEVLGVELDDGLLIVDVSDDIHDAATGAAGENAFLQALAHTGTQFDTVDGVELLVEGEAITELWGHIELPKPLTEDPDARSPIDVERPRYGETWPPGPVTVTGTSVTYESTVELELVDPDGNVVEQTFTTADQPDVGERGPFQHTFDTEADTPGTWTVRVREPDPSDGEGRPPFVADIELEIE